jgi:hypothetical protein
MELKVKIEIPITFKVLYSDKNAAKADQCKTIERRVDQTISIEVPSEVAGLIQNLKWSATLALWVSINAQTGVDLENINTKQEGKSFLSRLHL